jgi:phage-related protein
MKESIDFSYAGILSTDMGLINVTVDSGMFEEPFLSEREMNEVQIRGRDKPYFHSIKNSPLILSLTFAFNDKYDESTLRAVARWLNQPYYQPFFTLENPNRIFYCILDSSSSLFHNGLGEGYMTVQMKCSDSHTYSPEYMSTVYDASNNTGVFNILFVNDGDITCRPEVWIEKIENGDIRIVNMDNGGVEFKFTNLTNGETVYVDSEDEVIKSSLLNTYRYNNFNNNFLELVRGSNSLQVYGKCKLQFRYEFKKLQG